MVSSLLVEPCDDLVELWQGDIHALETGVVVVRCRHISQLVLDNCEHFADCEENASSEFVLVIYLQPPCEITSNCGFQDLSTW